MLGRIYDFYIDYEEMINFLIIIICFLVLSLFVVKYFDKELTREKNIIENTKEYTIHDNCKKLDDKYYCWEENDD